MVNILLGVMSAIALTFGFVFTKDIKVNGPKNQKGIVKTGLIIGFITDFFDAIGVGSFATTTAIFKLCKRVNVPDKILPGTLNVAHSLPMVVQALLTLTVIEVDSFTVITLIVAAVLGSWIGAGIISKLPENVVQLTIAIALIATVFILILGQLNLMPSGGEALGLEGGKLAIGIVGSFILGALMTAGIGFYAPCMAMIALLGMNPMTSFPIMAGACGCLGPIASIKFIKEEAYAKEISVGIAIGGVVGSALAIMFVSSLPVYWLKWLVVLVCLYTSVIMFKQAKSKNVEDELSDNSVALEN